MLWSTERQQITVEGKTYSVRTLVVADMAALVKILNLYDVFNNKTTWKCCWCLCSNDKIGDMEVPSWPFRSETDWQQKETLWAEKNRAVQS